MLDKVPMTTILPVKDMQRAREFYENRLDLTPQQGLKPDGKFVCGGGALLALFPKPEGTKAQHTAVSWEVANIGQAIKALQEKGVVFNDYDFSRLQDPSIMYACWDRKRLHGSTLRRAISSACTSPSPKQQAASDRDALLVAWQPSGSWSSLKKMSHR